MMMAKMELILKMLGMGYLIVLAAIVLAVLIYTFIAVVRAMIKSISKSKK